jgi:hypothetical protein
MISEYTEGERERERHTHTHSSSRDRRTAGMERAHDIGGCR